MTPVAVQVVVELGYEATSTAFEIDESVVVTVPPPPSSTPLAHVAVADSVVFARTPAEVV